MYCTEKLKAQKKRKLKSWKLTCACATWQRKRELHKNRGARRERESEALRLNGRKRERERIAAHGASACKNPSRKKYPLERSVTLAVIARPGHRLPFFLKTYPNLLYTWSSKLASFSPTNRAAIGKNEKRHILFGWKSHINRQNKRSKQRKKVNRNKKNKHVNPQHCFKT